MYNGKETCISWLCLEIFSLDLAMDILAAVTVLYLETCFCSQLEQDQKEFGMSIASPHSKKVCLSIATVPTFPWTRGGRIMLALCGGNIGCVRRSQFVKQSIYVHTCYVPCKHAISDRLYFHIYARKHKIERKRSLQERDSKRKTKDTKKDDEEESCSIP